MEEGNPLRELVGRSGREARSRVEHGSATSKNPDHVVATIDAAHFRVYRRNKREAIPFLSPPDCRAGFPLRTQRDFNRKLDDGGQEAENGGRHEFRESLRSLRERILKAEPEAEIRSRRAAWLF